jgi:hypothetical protein
MAAQATRLFGQPTPENRGPSFAISVAITAALFAFALAAMRSLPNFEIGRRSIERPIAVQLPQVVVPEPIKAQQPTDRTTSRARPAAPTAVPTTIGAPTTSVAPPITTPITTPTGVPSAPRDTNLAGAGKTSAADAALRGTLRPGPTGLGVPMAPGWTKSAEHVGNTAAIRDSMLRTKLAEIPTAWKTHPPTGAEKAALETSQKIAAALQRRSTTAGNSNDLVHLQGKGMDGVGAVSAPGLVTIDAPFLSSGPSKAQRKKNEAIDAEYQARLRGFQDLVLSLRDKRVADSLRLDSLRLDSLRRDSLARRPKPPSADTLSDY